MTVESVDARPYPKFCNTGNVYSSQMLALDTTPAPESGLI